MNAPADRFAAVLGADRGTDTPSLDRRDAATPGDALFYELLAGNGPSGSAVEAVVTAAAETPRENALSFCKATQLDPLVGSFKRRDRTAFDAARKLLVAQLDEAYAAGNLAEGDDVTRLAAGIADDTYRDAVAHMAYTTPWVVCHALIGRERYDALCARYDVDDELPYNRLTVEDLRQCADGYWQLLPDETFAEVTAAATLLATVARIAEQAGAGATLRNGRGRGPTVRS